ncbi:MAG: hypothetical protein HQM14_03480 [SAR324 cluster bacterium]|nr:hypothetical protein [SAR324 cluster bacterium]
MQLLLICQQGNRIKKSLPWEHYQTVEKDHERIEIRDYWLFSQIEDLPGRFAWEGLQSIGCVKSQRIIGNSTSTEIRYYITSLDQGIQRFAGNAQTI